MNAARTLLLFAVTSFAVQLAADGCEAPINDAISRKLQRMSRLGDLGAVLIARASAGDVTPGLVDWALQQRSTPIAEELLHDFARRNATSAELDGRLPFKSIDLRDYRSGAGIDWERVTRDFGRTDTIVELSRPGCDSLGTFGVIQLRLHQRAGGNIVDAWMLHLSKRVDATWRTDLVRMGTTASLFGGGCDTRSNHPDYAEVCARYAK